VFNLTVRYSTYMCMVFISLFLARCSVISYFYSSPWWWRQQGPLKRWYNSTRLHGATTQKTAIFSYFYGRSKPCFSNTTHFRISYKRKYKGMLYNENALIENHKCGSKYSSSGNTHSESTAIVLLIKFSKPILRYNVNTDPDLICSQLSIA
jgi:hypothetical protein